MSPSLLLFSFVAGIACTLLVVSLIRHFTPSKPRAGPQRELLGKVCAHVTTSEHREAIAALRALIENQPDEPGFYLLLARQQIAGGEIARATRTLDVLLSQRELSAESRAAALLLRGEIAELSQRDEEALLAFEQASVDAPRSTAPLFAQERILTRRGDWKPAIQVALKLAALRPERGRLVAARRRVMLARELLAAGQVVAAGSELDRAIEEAPDLAAAHLTRGDLRFQQRDVRGAKAEWVRAAELAPGLAPQVVDRWEAIIAETKDGHALRDFAADAVERTTDAAPRWRLLAFLTDEALRRGAPGEARQWSDRLHADARLSVSAARLQFRVALAEDARPLGTRLNALRQSWELEGPAVDVWRCQRCGRAANEFDWRCPQCQAWESLS